MIYPGLVKKVFFSFLVSVCAPVLAQEWRAVDRCIDYSKYERHVHLIRADLTCPGIRLFGTSETEKGMTTSKFAERTAATVAINGDFYNSGFVPRGLNISDSRLWKGTRDKIDRSFLACSSGNRCQIDPVDHEATPRPEWETAVGGWQTYVDGNFVCARESSPSCTVSNGGTAHPRTAVGLDAARKRIFFIVVEGRQADYPGMTLEQLGGVFRKLGIAEGLNLDGGGSSTLVVLGRRVNALPVNQPEERRVANHLGIRTE